MLRCMFVMVFMSIKMVAYHITVTASVRDFFLHLPDYVNYSLSVLHQALHVVQLCYALPVS
jgi:hypothetical protein